MLNRQFNSIYNYYLFWNPLNNNSGSLYIGSRFYIRKGFQFVVIALFDPLFNGLDPVLYIYYKSIIAQGKSSPNTPLKHSYYVSHGRRSVIISTRTSKIPDPLTCLSVCAVSDLERRIQDSINTKDQKAKEVEELLEAAEELRYNITEKAKGYSSCIQCSPGEVSPARLPTANACVYLTQHIHTQVAFVWLENKMIPREIYMHTKLLQTYYSIFDVVIYSIINTKCLHNEYVLYCVYFVF